MQTYSQKDSRWGKLKLGTCTDTIAQSGCVITCLGMLSDTTPDQVNQLLKDRGGFSDGCLIKWTQAATIMGLDYLGKTTANPKVFPCIGCTDHYSKIVNGKETGTPQHFFVMIDATTILDPLDGKQKTNSYHITKFENVTTKDDMSQADKDELQALRQFKQEVVGNKTNEYRIDGQATVYQIYAIPSTEHFDALGDKWEDVRILPADWPVHPEEWVANRNVILQHLQDTLQGAQKLQDQITALQQQIADSGQSGHDLAGQIADLTDKNTKLVQRVKDLTDQLIEAGKQESPVDQEVDLIMVDAETGGFKSKLAWFFINLGINIHKNKKNE